ncbi:right-handed parallel beta-helix repeat-containing protein [uncultured Sphingomonas sp.]|uniref:right-handed parallel beta-helix repeat-containing protein n=1 Tax=uncultured Sphingomonas sp. TaxID=158754 RepID=UPI0025E82A42|nr:right-handed parallel beta-helix repeat-containing protein [uncultured Sphingomonas sp.]
MPHETDRRRLLGLFGAIPLLSVPACNAANAVEPVEAPTLRQRGDVGDTAALARALASGRPVQLPAGGGSGPRGEYIVDMLELPDGATISGEGMGTVLRSSSARVQSILLVSGAAAQTRNLTLRDMKLVGHATSDGFREHHNLVSLSGVADCLIEGVTFEGFAGDGIYLGGERDGPVRTPRSNARVTIRDCTFDGINNANRNAISVTGGTDIVIDDCRFMRCSRPDMPGPIDFEADDFPFYVFDRLTVTNCSFERCGGNVGQISIVTPPRVRQVPRNIRIAGNRFAGYAGSGSDIALTVGRPATAAMPDMNVVIENNVGSNGRAGVRLYSGRGITLRNNRWTRYLGQMFVGYAEARDGCRDVSVADRFEACGTQDGAAIGIFNADTVSIAGSSFVDCGNGRADAACIRLGPGRSSGVAIRGNDFAGSVGRAAPIRQTAGHRSSDRILLEPASLSILGPGERR